MKKLLIVGAAGALILAGCTTRQENAGINYVKVDYCFEEEQISQNLIDKIQVEGVDGEQLAAILSVLPVSWSPCGVEIADGKERSDVSFTFVSPDGFGFEYSAGEEKAFEGQRIRGEVEKAQIEVLGEIIPGLTDAIIGAINPATGLSSALNTENVDDGEE